MSAIQECYGDNNRSSKCYMGFCTPKRTVIDLKKQKQKQHVGKGGAVATFEGAVMFRGAATSEA